MNNKLEDSLDDFNKDDETQNKTDKNKVRKQVVLQNFSIIERVDKIYVTDDGRQLLREQF